MIRCRFADNLALVYDDVEAGFGAAPTSIAPSNNTALLLTWEPFKITRQFLAVHTPAFSINTSNTISWGQFPYLAIRTSPIIDIDDFPTHKGTSRRFFFQVLNFGTSDNN